MAKFVFVLIGGGTEVVLGTTTKMKCIEKEAETVDLAYDAAAAEVPEGARIWTWFLQPDGPQEDEG